MHHLNYYGRHHPHDQRHSVTTFLRAVNQRIKNCDKPKKSNVIRTSLTPLRRAVLKWLLVGNCDTNFDANLDAQAENW